MADRKRRVTAALKAARVRISVKPVGRLMRKAETRHLHQLLRDQKETAPVVGDMRRAARY